MKCPNCGNELRRSLSFCPKCGNVVSQVKPDSTQTANNWAAQTKKKTPIWKIILGILFFPIALTIMIAKNKKLKPIIKIVLIVTLWGLVLAVSVSNMDKTTLNNDSNISDSSYKEQIDDETPTVNYDKQISAPESNAAVNYHNSKDINRLLTSYNSIAEYPITPEMVRNGAYDFNANISCNGVWIAIYASGNNGIFVDYSDEAANDSAIYPIFRDFCKTLNPEITSEDVDATWTILQTKKYQNYDAYDFEGIECTYSESPLSNGDHRYIIKTNCKSY